MQCSGLGLGHICLWGRTESVLSYDYGILPTSDALYLWDDSSSLIIVLYMVRSWSFYRKKNYLLLTALSQ